MEIGIIDYGLNNLQSVKYACIQNKLNPIITNEHDKLLNCKCVILPGIGSFGEAMKRINYLKVDRTINKFLDTGKPFVAICLGLHLLFEESEESLGIKGLKIFKGNITKLNSNITNEKKLKVPHIGWNKVSIPKSVYNKDLLKNITNNESLYFIHSYYLDYNMIDFFRASTIYGKNKICSYFANSNLYAFQFHPEKSGNQGMQIFKNLKEIISN